MKYIRVKVSAGSKKENLKQVKENRFEISVKQKAKNNEANKRVIEILADFFNLPNKKIRIVNGHHASTKLLVLDVIE